MKYLSILKNANDGCITYYTGTDPSHVSHLKNCTLLCNHELHIANPQGIEFIRSNDPQLDFYKLSKNYKKDYLERESLVYNKKYKSYIHQNCKIEKNVKIGPNCVIGNCEIKKGVEIEANATVYSYTIIDENTKIGSGVSIGSAGIMWVWDGDGKVFLEQLGNVIIGKNCLIGSLTEISRGSANESTEIKDNVYLAHGCLIGHGTIIGEYTHFANGVKTGGSSKIGNRCFLGIGAVVSAGVKIHCENVVLGASATALRDIVESGVYVGTPAKKIKQATGKLSGMPAWKNV